MKTIKITTDNKLSIIDVDFDDYRDIQKAVGCECFETVKTQRLFDFFGGPVLFCVDTGWQVSFMAPGHMEARS